MRVSSVRQAAEGLSLEVQRQRLQRYAALHNAEIEIFEDSGISGRRQDPPRAPAFCPRSTASTRQLLDVTDDLQARDVRLVSLTESIDTATATAG